MHTYGPINSRRLGRSLGIDIVGTKDLKVCNLNCLYCECGKTNKLQLNLGVYKDFIEVTNELSRYNFEEIDYVSFSGFGEPTLSSDLEKYILFLKKNYDVKVCVITNSLLLNNDTVIKALNLADCVMPSLDGADELTLRKIDIPDKSFNFDNYIKSLISFSNQYENEFYLEIFFIENINDSKEQLDKFIKIIKQMKITKIFLNRLDRPGAFKKATRVSDEKMEEIKEYLEKNQNNILEII